MKDKDVKDFLEVAKKSGRIRDVKEALIEYPVENEWHKGKIANILELNDNIMKSILYIK